MIDECLMCDVLFYRSGARVCDHIEVKFVCCVFV